MDRIPLRLAALLLGLSLLAIPLTAGSTALARDDDNRKATPTPTPDTALFDAQVAGTVYRTFQNAGATVLSVLDRDSGLSVDVYVRDPRLLDLISSNTACVGRYVTAAGRRTSPTTLTAQGLRVDTSTGCTAPPS
jgi:hypothetical protein